MWQASGLAARGWCLRIAGEGQELAGLSSLAVALGVDESVRFLGSRPDVADLYRESAVLLAPRSDEPLGLTVLEAMSAGLPVVAASGGGHDETSGRVPDACLFAADDINAGGRILADLALDGPRRDRYASAAREVQRRDFTLRGQAERTLAVYERVLRARRS